MSRSMTNSVWGWSIFTSSCGGKANIPLAAALAWSWRAKPRIWSVSAVEARMNSTGNWPPPGSAGGVTGNTCTPGMAMSLPCTSGRSPNTVRLRSSQGLVTMPLKPLLGKVIWKVNSVSGKVWNTLFTAAA